MFFIGVACFVGHWSLSHLGVWNAFNRVATLTWESGLAFLMWVTQWSLKWLSWRKHGSYRTVRRFCYSNAIQLLLTDCLSAMRCLDGNPVLEALQQQGSPHLLAYFSSLTFIDASNRSDESTWPTVADLLLLSQDLLRGPNGSCLRGIKSFVARM